jgi:hypothetical protein
MSRVLTAVDIPFSKPVDGGASAATREFRQTDEDCYVLGLLELGVEFHANYLRRERYETFGELVVLCDLAGARNVCGNVLSRGTFNFSSTEARWKRAKQLADMSKAPELDWPRLLEEVCVTVLAKQGDGEPAVLLRDLPRPSPDALLDVDGLRLLKQHPVILFGDGGAAKSYLALYLAGRLAERGLRVGVLDWELAGEDHRDRLERLFGPDMPAVWYRRCRHPLIVELDSLRRWVRRDGLDYLVYDSVAFAAHDKPEAAESAIRYFSATRQIGPGSLHVAHINRSESGEDKPFGSAYWHNSARATYFMKRAESESGDGRDITIGLFNKKSNLGALLPAFGFQFRFDDDRTIVTRTNLAEVQDLSQKLPLWQRLTHVLKAASRPLTLAELADELDAKVDTVTKAVARSKAFTRVLSADGIQRISLVERRSA